MTIKVKMTVHEMERKLKDIDEYISNKTIPEGLAFGMVLDDEFNICFLDNEADIEAKFGFIDFLELATSELDEINEVIHSEQEKQNMDGLISLSNYLKRSYTSIIMYASLRLYKEKEKNPFPSLKHISERNTEVA